MNKITLRLFSVIVVILLSVNIFAQAAVETALSEEQVSERINYIQTVFDDGQTCAAAWSYTWTGLYTGLTGYFLYASIANEDGRPGNIVSTVKTSFSTIMLIVSPFHPRSAGSDLSEINASTPEERAAKLKRAEEMLERNYLKAKGGKSLKKHLITIGVNLVGGLVVYGFEGWGGWNDGLKPGLISFVGGVILGEACILTQPSRAVDDYENYNSKYKPVISMIPEKKNDFYWSVYPGGFAAGIRF